MFDLHHSLRTVLGAGSLAIALGCAPIDSAAPTTTAPTIQEVPPIARYPDVGLPYHRAPIVDLALLPPQAGEQWRLASGDEDGWVRIWADGRLLAAAVAHPGGLTALARSRPRSRRRAREDARGGAATRCGSDRRSRSAAARRTRPAG